MHASQNEPARNLTGLESRPLGARTEVERTKDFLRQNLKVSCWQLAEGAKLSSGTAPNLTGFETDLWTQDLKSSEQQNFTPKSESELLADRESAGAREPDLPADRIEHVTHPDVSGGACL